MQVRRDGGSGSRGLCLLRWAERLFVIAGAAMLVWSALLVTDARIAQRIARRSLEVASHSDTSPDSRGPNAPTGAPLHAPTVLRASAIANLSIPRVHLSAVVLHGSDDRTLRRGPGHLENTALPGESGNAVIAGHRDSFFRPLRNVQRGDDIFVDTPQGRFHYRVTSLDVVNAHDLSVLEPADTAVLTLITCYPFWVLGHAPDRFVVRAARVVDSTVPAFAMHETPRPDQVRAPLAQGTAAEEVVVPETHAVRDDQALVRDAIERFRVRYNARLISHNDSRAGGPVRFQTCDVSTIDDDQAAATCETSARSSDDREPSVLTFTLERVPDGWTIRSIASQ